MADSRYNDLAASPQKPVKFDQSSNNVTIALENAALSVDSPMLVPSDISAVSSAAFASDTQKLTGNGDEKPGKPNAYRRYGAVLDFSDAKHDMLQWRCGSIQSCLEKTICCNAQGFMRVFEAANSRVHSNTRAKCERSIIKCADCAFRRSTLVK